MAIKLDVRLSRHWDAFRSIQLGTGFNIFPIIELKKLGRQNYKFGLYSKKFLPLKMEGHLETLLKNIITNKQWLSDSVAFEDLFN
jgi:hypothetical protein